MLVSWLDLNGRLIRVRDLHKQTSINAREEGWLVSRVNVSLERQRGEGERERERLLQFCHRNQKHASVQTSTVPSSSAAIFKLRLTLKGGMEYYV